MVFLEVLKDVSLAARTLRKSPGYAAIVVVTLGIGIAASALVVSLMSPYLIRPLPFSDSERLVQIGQIDPREGWDSGRFSLPMLRDWEARTQSFDALGAYYYRSSNLGSEGEGPERIIAGVLSGNMFEVLGVEARLGRTFETGEDGPGGRDVVVLSDGLWRRRYGQDVAILGRTVTLDGSAFTVIGVMPPEFNFPFGGVRLWVPAREDAATEPRDRDRFIPVGRLKSGVSRDRAKADLTSIQRELRLLYPDADGRFDGVSVKSMREALNFAFDVMETSFAVLVAAVAFVLLIACVNVTSLTLARASLARREVAVRSALGASRARLVRHLASESLLLALAGGATGVLLATWGARALGRLVPEELFRVGEIRVDVSVVLVSMVVTLATPIVFGLLPALAASRFDLASALKEGSRSGSGRSTLRFRRALVVAEIAMALVLVSGTGLMLRSFLELSNVDLGFRPERLLTIEVTLPESEYGDRASERSYFERATSQLRLLAPVLSAGTVVPLPMNHAIWTVPFALPESAPSDRESWPQAREFRISPGGFEALGITLLAGRGIESVDGPASPRVVVVSASLAGRHFAGRNPIGETLLLGEGESATPATIVGIAADVRHEGYADERPDQIYRSVDESGSRGRFFVVRTSGAPEAVIAAAKEVLERVDPNLPITPRPMREIVRESALQWSLSALLLGIFGAVAIGLASLGIYGIVAFSVSARRREIGIRMALGATRPDVRKRVLGEGMRLGALGLLIGLTLAAVESRLIASLLFHVEPFDPLTVATVIALFAIVPLAASLLPAARAGRTDPVSALRDE
jgi:putative ABC transport system permease protein